MDSVDRRFLYGIIRWHQHQARYKRQSNHDCLLRIGIDCDVSRWYLCYQAKIQVVILLDSPANHCEEYDDNRKVLLR